MGTISLHAQLTVLWVTGIAALCGAAIGLERERCRKAAGLRTHMLVAAASAMATGVGAALTGDRGDPTRVLHGIITGIGFLGSGVIFRDRKGTAGLTSAAVIMLTAMIGAACGLGAPVLAVGVTFFALSTLWYVKRVEHTFTTRWSEPRPRRPQPRRPASGVLADLRAVTIDLRPQPRPRPAEIRRNPRPTPRRDC